MTIARESKTALIFAGTVLRVVWMYYQRRFPAKVFLKQSGDMTRFNRRVEEMGNTGRIALYSHGHQLEGPYGALHQFKMGGSRSWGFIHDRPSRAPTYVVLYAATKKKPKDQIHDYEKALGLRADYLTGLDQ